MLLDLPAELIEAIFSTCVFQARIPVERLASINHYLRQVALQQTELWTELHYEQPRNLSRIACYIARSGIRPIRFEIDSHITSAAFDELLVLLRSQLHRLKGLRIMRQDPERSIAHTTHSEALGPPVNGVELLTLFSGSTPQLEELNLDFPFYPDTHFPAVLHVAESPPLKKLSAFNSLTPDLAVKWARLENLKCDLTEHTSTHFPELNWLASLPLLATLELRLSTPTGRASDADSWAASSQPCGLTLPSLTELRIHSHSLHLLIQFNCPLLSKCLVDGWVIKGTEEHFRSLWRFLVHHAGTLRDVHMGHDGFYRTGSHTTVYQEGTTYQPTLFPLLHSFVGVIFDPPSIFSKIRATSLRHVWLSVEAGARGYDILNFLDAASPSLEDVTIAEAQPLKSRGTEGIQLVTIVLKFPRLKTFVSMCKTGDLVVSAIREAPVLEELTLHGDLPPVCCFSIARALRI